MSLRAKLLIPLVSLLLVGFCLVGAVAYMQSKAALEKATHAEIAAHAASVYSILSAVFTDAALDMQSTQATAAVQELFGSPEGRTAAEVQAASKALQVFADAYSIYQEAYVTDERGTVIAAGHPDMMNRQLGGEEFIQKALRGEAAVSRTEVSTRLYEGRYNTLVSLAVPVTMEGKSTPVGTLVGRVSMSVFADRYTKGRVIGDHGYLLLLDREGNVLSHPDTSLVMQNKGLTEAGFASLRAATGTGSVEFMRDGKLRIAFYKRDTATGILVAGASTVDDILAPIYTLRNFIAGLALGTMAAVVAAAVVTISLMARNLGLTVNFAHSVASGKLDETLAYQSKDEVGVLADALRTMVNNLRTTLRTAEQRTEEALTQTERAEAAIREANEARARADSARKEGLLHAAENLRGIVSVINATSDALEKRIGKAAHGADIQRERTTETATAMEEMNATVIEVARSAAGASKSAETARQMAEEGAEMVRSVVSAIEEVNTQARRLKEGLDGLGAKAQGIGQIMTVISDIADQTNQLALNAAIEAARAGDAGRGFAVVADEVRKLAEKTMTATREVGEAVQAIQAGTNENIKEMDRASQAVERSTSLALKAGDSLHSIVKVVESSADQVRSIATASEEQSAASEEITRSTETVSSIAAESAQYMEESSRGVRDLAEAARNLTAVMEELAAS